MKSSIYITAVLFLFPIIAFAQSGKYILNLGNYQPNQKLEKFLGQPLNYFLKSLEKDSINSDLYERDIPDPNDFYNVNKNIGKYYGLTYHNAERSLACYKGLCFDNIHIVVTQNGNIVGILAYEQEMDKTKFRNVISNISKVKRPHLGLTDRSSEERFAKTMFEYKNYYLVFNELITDEQSTEPNKSNTVNVELILVNKVVKQEYKAYLGF